METGALYMILAGSAVVLSIVAGVVYCFFTGWCGGAPLRKRLEAEMDIKIPPHNTLPHDSDSDVRTNDDVTNNTSGDVTSKEHLDSNGSVARMDMSIIGVDYMVTMDTYTGRESFVRGDYDVRQIGESTLL